MSNMKDKGIRKILQIVVSPKLIKMLQRKLINLEHKFRCLLLKMLKQ